MKRDAAERSYPDSLAFETAKCPDDRADYCLGQRERSKIWIGASFGQVINSRTWTTLDVILDKERPTGRPVQVDGQCSACKAYCSSFWTVGQLELGRVMRCVRHLGFQSVSHDPKLSREAILFGSTTFSEIVYFTICNLADYSGEPRTECS